MTELEALTPEKLAELLGGTGRARAVWRAMLQGKDPFEDPELSRPVRERLRAHTSLTHLLVARRDVAACGTTKLRLVLADQRRIETVLIPSPCRTTVCVSTQAGCARGCIFCLTATMGLERGLTAGEIVGQVLLATRDALAAHLPAIRNVVFMGMGEPFSVILRASRLAPHTSRSLPLAPRRTPSLRRAIFPCSSRGRFTRSTTRCACGSFQRCVIRPKPSDKPSSTVSRKLEGVSLSK